MAKHHPSPSPLSAGGAHASPSTLSLPNSQLSLQLRQDFAKLAHKDPDTRRSSMEALKGFIERELDAHRMPTFLEQISGETNKGSGTCAIYLFVDVVRVHKQRTVPFIPRIMTAVLRCLASSSGGAGHTNNLHQACAKVVYAVTRYAIEPASSSSSHSFSSTTTDVLDSLCQPLVGLLSSNVEPVAVGSATCLQAIVEAENWKLATPELVHDVCGKSCIALIDKGKHTIMHMHLVRSLAKFNPQALQDYGTSLLKIGVQILAGGNTTACGPWQQRVAASQLLGTLLGCLDQGILASELVSTMEALDCCRLDKVTMVRHAVGEALSIAKNLASEIGPVLQHEGVPKTTAAIARPPHSRLLDSRKRNDKKKREEESCKSTATSDYIMMGPQESHAVSYTSSPSSSITTVSTPLNSPFSAVELGRSHLYPAKLSPPISFECYMTDSEIPCSLAHLKPSDSKENVCLIDKSGEFLVTRKFDDLSHAIHGRSRNIHMKEVVDDYEEVMANNNTCTKQNEPEGLLSLDTDDLEADLGSERDFGMDLREPTKWDGTWEQQPWRERLQECESEGGNVQRGAFTATTCHTLFPTTKDNEQGGPHAQASKKCMSAQDFLIFSTPRRLVRSLQSIRSTPDSKCSPKRSQGADVDCETLSESGWSVRDNPIAGDSEEEDSPRKVLVSNRRNVLMQSKDCSCCKGGSMSSTEDEKRIDCLQAGDAVNSMVESSSGSTSFRDSRDVPEKEDHEGWIQQKGGPKSGQSDASETEEPYGVVKKEIAGSRASRDWALLARRMHDYTELFLFVALLVMLAFTALIAMLSCIRGQYDPDMLVPT